MASVPADLARSGAPASASTLRIPVGLLALGVGIWGLGHEEWLLACALALLVESARAVRVRWDFDDTDFHRLADTTSVMLLLVAAVQFSDRGLAGIYGVLKWFPLALLPLMLAQCYSTRETVKLSALFLSVRFALRRGRIREPGELDMRAPFLIACLLSATAGSGRGDWLIPVEAAVLAWLLLANAPGRSGAVRIAVALVLSAVMAVSALLAIQATRRALEPLIMDIVREHMAHWRDPFRSYTALGEVGRLKSSDRIVLRVTSPPGVPVPPLLREATFTQFSRNTWLAGETRFDELTPNADGTRWDLAQGPTPFQVVTVAKSLVRNRGMLAVPNGGFRLEELPVEELRMSPLAALKVVSGPPLVEYRVRYAPGAGTDAAPSDRDRTVPPELQPSLDRFLVEAGARGVPPRQAVGRIWQHFQQAFSYSLTLRRPTHAPHPVAGFLDETRSGHCEFFATATVLLLRQAGIPARYASGYAIQEWSEREQAYIARRRHSHTWAIAWIAGRWVDVDTTPAAWFEEEALGGPWWTGLLDRASHLWFAWSRWRLLRAGEESDNTALLWLLVPLGAVLIYRVQRGRRVRLDRPLRRRRTSSTPTASPFREIEATLARHGHVRPAWLPLGAWLASLEARGAVAGVEELRGRVLALHNRACFHPEGLDPRQGAELAQRVREWLSRHAHPGGSG